MRSNSRRRLRFTSVALVCLAARSLRRAATTTATRTPPPPPRRRRTTTAASEDAAPADDADAALDELVAAAQEEGSVTIYSSQGLDQLNALGAAFEEEYGIHVEVVRGTDGDIIPRVETELATNTSGGDLVVTAAPGCSWRRTPRPATGSTRPPARSSPASATTTPSSTCTTATSSRSAPPCSPSRGTPNACPTGLDRLPRPARPVAGRRQDRRARPGDRPGPRRLLPLAGGELRRGLRRRPGGPGAPDLPELAADRRGVDLRRDLRRRLRRPGAARAGGRQNGAPVDFGISEDAGAWGARYFGAIPKCPTARTRRRCSPTSW